MIESYLFGGFLSLQEIKRKLFNVKTDFVHTIDAQSEYIVGRSLELVGKKSSKNIRI
jgi:hypothetical protein